MGRPPSKQTKQERSSWGAPSINTSVRRSFLRRESKDREYEKAIANLKRLGIIPEDWDAKWED